MRSELARFSTALTALPLDPARVRRVLEVGCGTFATAAILRGAFPAALVIGVDHDPGVLRSQPGTAVLVQNLMTCLESRGSNTGEPGGFIQGISLDCTLAADAARLPLAAHVRFDLIVVRHPDVARLPDRWRAVCAALPGRLTRQGVVLITTYTPDEQAWMQTALRRHGLLPQPVSPDLAPVDLAGHDRFVRVYGLPAG
jgi:SAM-dependent methyltransferase